VVRDSKQREGIAHSDGTKTYRTAAAYKDNRIGCVRWRAVSIGAVLAFLSNFLLQSMTTRRDREHTTIVEVARSQDAAFATYTEKMSELLIEQNLPERSNDSEARRVAQGLTISSLLRLDEFHKKRVLELVYALGLIEKGKPLLDLSNASLDRARLSGLTLRNVCLKGANLREADLYGADLEGSDLSQADLRGANLSGADLSGANLLPYDIDDPARWSQHNLDKRSTLNIGEPLSRKGLIATKLRGAILRDAQLRNAWLHGVALSGADLKGVKGITTEELVQQALRYSNYSLNGATMPDGQKYEDWLKSKGSAGSQENTEAQAP
jgi:hypothetical protein